MTIKLRLKRSVTGKETVGSTEWNVLPCGPQVDKTLL